MMVKIFEELEFVFLIDTQFEWLEFGFFRGNLANMKTLDYYLTFASASYSTEIVFTLVPLEWFIYLVL